jgi:hypothetical protein
LERLREQELLRVFFSSKIVIVLAFYSFLPSSSSFASVVCPAFLLFNNYSSEDVSNKEKTGEKEMREFFLMGILPDISPDRYAKAVLKGRCGV